MRIYRPALLTVASLGSAAVFGTGVARADEDGYLSLLTRYGFDVGTPYRAEMMLKFGHAICNDLRNGASPADEAATVFRMGPPNATEKKSGNLVSAAQFQLCPDTL